MGRRTRAAGHGRQTRAAGHKPTDTSRCGLRPPGMGRRTWASGHGRRTRPPDRRTRALKHGPPDTDSQTRAHGHGSTGHGLPDTDRLTQASGHGPPDMGCRTPVAGLGPPDTGFQTGGHKPSDTDCRTRAAGHGRQTRAAVYEPPDTNRHRHKLPDVGRRTRAPDTVAGHGPPDTGRRAQFFPQKTGPVSEPRKRSDGPESGLPARFPGPKTETVFRRFFWSRTHDKNKKRNNKAIASYPSALTGEPLLLRTVARVARRTPSRRGNQKRIRTGRLRCMPRVVAGRRPRPTRTAAARRPLGAASSRPSAAIVRGSAASPAGACWLSRRSLQRRACAAAEAQVELARALRARTSSSTSTRKPHLFSDAMCSRSSTDSAGVFSPTRCLHLISPRASASGAAAAPPLPASINPLRARWMQSSMSTAGRQRSRPPAPAISLGPGAGSPASAPASPGARQAAGARYRRRCRSIRPILRELTRRAQHSSSLRGHGGRVGAQRGCRLAQRHATARAIAPEGARAKGTARLHRASPPDRHRHAASYTPRERACCAPNMTRRSSARPRTSVAGLRRTFAGPPTERDA